MSVPLKEIPGGPPVPDVEALVRGLRERVADRVRRGDYTPADLVELRRLGRGSRERDAAGLAPADDLSLLHFASDPLGPHTFTSHRARLGPLVVMAKRWLRRLARPVAAVTLAPQAQFNGAAARLITGASRGVQSLEAGQEALLRLVDELEVRNQELHARCGELQAEVRGQGERLERLERAVKPE